MFYIMGINMENLNNYAEKMIISIGGNEADIEQIINEIRENNYKTKEEIKWHLENYYM